MHVVHAVEPLSLFAESVLQTYVEETRLRELREKGMQVVLESIRQRVLESFREEMQDAGQDMQLIASLQVVQGDPPQVILDEANRLGVELVVVGSHSHGTAWDAPLGVRPCACCSWPRCRCTWCPCCSTAGAGISDRSSDGRQAE